MKIKAFWNNIKRDIAMYLAVLIIIPIAVALIASNITKTPRNRQFGFFVTCGEVKQDKVAEVFNDVMLNNVDEFFVYFQSAKNDPAQYYRYLEAYGTTFSDLIIVPDNFCDDAFLDYCGGAFKTFDEKGKNKDGVTWATCIYEKGGTNKYSSLFTFDVDINYYLVINRNSPFYKEYKDNDESFLNKAIGSFLNYGK